MTQTLDLADQLNVILTSPSEDFFELIAEAGLQSARDLAGADLRDLDFGVRRMAGWDLRHCDLSGADLSRAAVTGCDFSHAVLQNARVNRSMLANNILPNLESTELNIVENLDKKFKVGESVVYPAHGVGKVAAVETQEVAGMSLEVYVVTFDHEKMTLRVPTKKAKTAGLRSLAADDVVTKALTTLKGRARIKRTMWSRRAQEYEAKINSGDLISIAEVLRDLNPSEARSDQHYSEQLLFEAALDRMSREIAMIDHTDLDAAKQRLLERLEHQPYSELIHRSAS